VDEDGDGEISDDEIEVERVTAMRDELREESDD